MKPVLLPLFVFLTLCAIAQTGDVNGYIRSGNAFYRQQLYEQAAAEYVRALQLDPGNITARNNHASALYKAGQQVEASQRFTELTGASFGREVQAAAYYNKGVILSAQKNLEESIEAYKNALRRDPADQKARENLQKALLELKKKNPPQPKDDDQKKQQKNQQQNQSKLNQREAEQRLKLLAEKEKEVQERLQKEKSRAGGGQGKDW